MNLLKQYVMIAILLFASSGASALEPRQVQAGAGPTTSAIVRCEPVVAAGPPGQQLIAHLYVENVSNLYGVEMQLSFDPALAQVVDSDPATPGVQIQPLGSFLSPDFVVRRTADNGAGVIEYAVTQLYPQPPASGSGPVAAIAFQSIANGTFSMPFNGAVLTDADGIEILATVLPCAVQFQPQRPCYDFNNTGIVDIADVMAVAVRWSLTSVVPDPDNNPGTPNFEPLYDLNGDQANTVLDIQMVAQRWQQSCS